MSAISSKSPQNQATQGKFLDIMRSAGFQVYSPATEDLRNRVRKALFDVPELLKFVTITCDKIRISGSSDGANIPESIREEHQKILQKLQKVIGKIDPAIFKQNIILEDFSAILCAFPEFKNLIDYFHDASTNELIPKQRIISTNTCFFTTLYSELERWGKKKQMKEWDEFADVLRQIIAMHLNFRGASANPKHCEKALWDQYKEKSDALEKAFRGIITAKPSEPGFTKIAGVLTKMFKIPCSFEELSSNYRPTILRLECQFELICVVWKDLCINFDLVQNREYPIDHTPISDEEVEREFYQKYSYSLNQMLNHLSICLPSLIISYEELSKRESSQLKRDSEKKNRIFLAQKESIQASLNSYNEYKEKLSSFIDKMKKEGVLSDVESIETFLWLERYTSRLQRDLSEFADEISSFEDKAIKKIEGDLRDLSNNLLTLLSQIKTYSFYMDDLKYDFRLTYGLSLELGDQVESKSPLSQTREAAGEQVKVEAASADSGEEDGFSLFTRVERSSDSVDALGAQLQRLKLNEGIYDKEAVQWVYDALGSMQLQLRFLAEQKPNVKRGVVNKIAYEIHSHAFLSIQNLIRAIYSYKKGVFKAEGGFLSLQTAIIDAHVAIEKIQNLQEYKNRGEEQRLHDFSRQIDPSYSQTAKTFLKESVKGTLAVRFPFIYPQNIPRLLKPVYDLESGVQKKIEAATKVVEVMLEILIKTDSAKDSPLIKELRDQLQTLSKAPLQQEGILQRPLTKSEVLGAFEPVNKELRTLKQITGRAGWRVQNIVKQIEFYKNLLEDAELYAFMHREPQEEFHKVRNLFVMEKMYEELLLFLLNMRRKQGSSVDNVHNFIGIMEELNKSGIQLDQRIQEHLKKINIGNNTHYLFTKDKGKKGSILAEFFKHSTQELLSDQGFEKKDQMLERKRIDGEMKDEIRQTEEAYRELLKFLPTMLFMVTEEFSHKNQKDFNLTSK